MDSQPRVYADWWSRVIALLSLVLSIGALGYTVIEHRVASNRADMLKQFSDELGRERQQVDDFLRIAKGDMDLALAKLDDTQVRARIVNKQPIDEGPPVEPKRLAVEDRNDNGNKGDVDAEGITANVKGLAVKSLLRMGFADGKSSDDDLTEEDALPDVDLPLNDDAQVEAMDFAEPLLVARRINYRPKPGVVPKPVLLLENTGDKDALIRRIKFRPRRTFALEKQAASNAADLLELEDSTPLDFTFLSQDNLSRDKKPLRHGIYDHAMKWDHRIKTFDRTAMTLAIEDAEHPNWGLQGDLTIYYNGKEDLVVKDVTVVLIDPLAPEL